jgi:D-alanyl-D-alanine carboxypeptidase
LTDVTNYSPSWGGAAGMLISNFADLKKWMKEIHERNLLSAATKEERFKWVDEGNGKSFYGFGLMKINGWIGHSGIISGYNSQIYYHPEKKITILVYTNCEDGEPAAMALLEFMKILTP